MSNGRPAPFHLVEGRYNPDHRNLCFLANPRWRNKSFANWKWWCHHSHPELQKTKLRHLKVFSGKTLNSDKMLWCYYFFLFLLSLRISAFLQKILFLDTLCIVVEVHFYGSVLYYIQLHPMIPYLHCLRPNKKPINAYQFHIWRSGKKIQRFGDQLSEVRFCFVLFLSAALGMGLRASYMPDKNSTTYTYY